MSPRKRPAAPRRGKKSTRPDPHRPTRTATGIGDLDRILGGGLPGGRTTLIQGAAGTGKTVLALEMMVRGARDLGCPAIFVAFEQSVDQLRQDTHNFGWDLGALETSGKVLFFDVTTPRDAVQSGAFDLVGLLATISAAARSSGARRVFLDGIDVLLGFLEDRAAARRELYRLADWLRHEGLTGIITAKVDRSTRSLGTYDFLEFLADCVLELELKLERRAATRRLRVSKLRGWSHSTSAFPFTISASGIDVAMPTQIELEHLASSERISSGVERLDTMLLGGYFRGSSTLVSGSPGTAKTTLAAAFAAASCARGEATLFLSFDEAAQQIVRNMTSVGIDLAEPLARGTLVMRSSRARTLSGDEHVVRMRNLILEHGIQNMVVDPISAFLHLGSRELAEEAGIQLLDLAKQLGVTVVSTTLLGGPPHQEATATKISTLADNWIHLSNVAAGGERNRALTIVKARGTAHSNQVRELVLTGNGITLADVFTAGGEVLMGTLRWEREQREREDARRKKRVIEQRRREAELSIAESEARAAALERILAGQRAELAELESSAKSERDQVTASEQQIQELRRGDVRREPRRRRRAR